MNKVYKTIDLKIHCIYQEVYIYYYEQKELNIGV